MFSPSLTLIAIDRLVSLVFPSEGMKRQKKPRRARVLEQHCHFFCSSAIRFCTSVRRGSRCFRFNRPSLYQLRRNSKSSSSPNSSSLFINITVQKPQPRKATSSVRNEPLRRRISFKCGGSSPSSQCSVPGCGPRICRLATSVGQFRVWSEDSALDTGCPQNGQRSRPES